MPEPPAPPPAPDLATIEARAAAATPGPWTLHDWTNDDQLNPNTITAWQVPATALQAQLVSQVHPGRWPLAITEPGSDIDLADAAFIAAARTDVPALVAYARALEAENAALRQALAPLATVPLADISPGEVARARALFDEGTLIPEDTPEMLARRRAWARKSIGW